MSRQTKRAALVFANLFGIALFLSWALPAHHGFWFAIDRDIFFAWNELLPQSRAFLYFVAFTNLRPFDLVPFLFMLAIFAHSYRKLDHQGRRWMLCMGAAMLISALIAKQGANLIDGNGRASASKYFLENGYPVFRASLLSGWPCKDIASSSFPGDHGMFLLIFVSFSLRYLGRRSFLASLAVFLVFSLPRIMSGAHWFTDIAVGSLSVACVIMSWMLLTPASDKLIGWLDRVFPDWLDRRISS